MGAHAYRNPGFRAKRERKTVEVALADAIICPSQFVYRSLPEGIRETKSCVVAEFGSPPFGQGSFVPKTKVCTLRVLFAGSMTQRKGLGDVLAAFRLLDRKDIELVIMGSLIAPMEFYRRQFPDFHYENLDHMRRSSH